MDTKLFFFVCGFVLALVLGYPYIKLMQRLQVKGQPIREDGPKGHKVKIGTPTMGGALILIPVLLVSLILPSLWSGVNIGILFIFLGYGVLGAIDDFKKIMKQNAYAGLTPKQKSIFQLGIAALGIMLISFYIPYDQLVKVYIPFFNTTLSLWNFYFPLALFIIVGTSNAVNLTDGLDGLVTIPVVITLAFFTLLILWVNPSFMLPLPVDQLMNIVYLILLIMGSCLGFLYFNLYPAKIFMGDIGSLSLGGFLGILSIVLKAEIFLAIVGMVFVVETFSVIIQVAYFKLTKKRFFKMAPIHHHFEHLGWHETTIVKVFWLASLIFAYIGLGMAELGGHS